MSLGKGTDKGVFWGVTVPDKEGNYYINSMVFCREQKTGNIQWDMLIFKFRFLSKTWCLPYIRGYMNLLFGRGMSEFASPEQGVDIVIV